MAVSKEQVQFGATIAGISAVVALLSSVLTLYTQASTVVEGAVNAKFKREFAPVGTVVASILPREAFAKATGETEGDWLDKRTWVLADGSMVTGTAYARLTGNKPVPNLQGMFLRGIDERNSRLPGQQEPWATGLPRNGFVGVAQSSGAHEHPNGMQFGNDAFNVGGHDVARPYYKPTGVAGAHEHPVTITGGGDSETRPTNVAVYYYIKVN